MLLNKNNFFQAKNKSRYKREISRILYEIIQEYNLPSFSLSYCEVSARGENVKVYLTFARKENPGKVLNLMNKQYCQLVKKKLAYSRKFSAIPNLIFLRDQELETINNLEKILQKFNYNLFLFKLYFRPLFGC
jgi:ribosome-binding factor A